MRNSAGLVMRKIFWLYVLIPVAIGGCSYINKQLGLRDDNLFEELLEEGIESQTGVDIDLSGDSPE